MTSFFSRLRKLRSFLPARSAGAAELMADFLRRPEHRWILTDEPFRDSLVELLCGFPESHLRRVLAEERLLLLFCNQRMSCALYPYENRSMVLVFPDLYQLMNSAHYHQAHAILAHELGHVFHRHAKVRISPIDAQLEADRYAFERGYGEELLIVLRGERVSAETRARIQALEQLLPRVA